MVSFRGDVKEKSPPPIIIYLVTSISLETTSISLYLDSIYGISEEVYDCQ